MNQKEGGNGQKEKKKRGGGFSCKRCWKKIKNKRETRIGTILLEAHTLFSGSGIVFNFEERCGLGPIVYI